MLEYLICDVLCTLDNLKYILMILIGLVVYNQLSQH
jgi:hypothetical protein